MKKIFRILFIGLLLAFGLLLCTSCGVRKSQMTKTEESTKIETSTALESETKSESNVKKTETVTVDDKNETITEETTYEPIDSTKPASVIDDNGRKTDLTNAKKTIKKVTKKNNTKTDIVNVSDEFNKSETITKQKYDTKSEENKVAKTKDTQRDAWSMWWLIIPAGVLYYVWKNKVAIGKKLTGLWWV